MTEQHDIKAVCQIMEVLEPQVIETIVRLIEHHGPTVALSVTTNLASTSIAMAARMVYDHGVDPSTFLSLVSDEIRSKYDNIQTKIPREDLHQSMH